MFIETFCVQATPKAAPRNGKCEGVAVDDVDPVGMAGPSPSTAGRRSGPRLFGNLTRLFGEYCEPVANCPLGRSRHERIRYRLRSRSAAEPAQSV